MDIRVAAYAVIVDRGGRMLLAHWVAGDRSAWTLPGGGLEPGEDPAVAVVREVREETGYDAEIDELLHVDSGVIPASQRISPGPALHNLRVIYRAHVVGGTLTNEVDGSTDTASWFSPEELDRLARVPLVDVARRSAGLLADTDDPPSRCRG